MAALVVQAVLRLCTLPKMKYAFINNESLVVNVIIGTLSEVQLQLFLHDYAVLYGATEWIAVDAESDVSRGYVYDADSNTFTLPPSEPQPEPLPEVQEPEL